MSLVRNQETLSVPARNKGSNGFNIFAIKYPAKNDFPFPRGIERAAVSTPGAGSGSDEAPLKRPENHVSVHGKIPPTPPPPRRIPRTGVPMPHILILLSIILNPPTRRRFLRSLAELDRLASMP